MCNGTMSPDDATHVDREELESKPSGAEGEGEDAHGYHSSLDEDYDEDDENGERDGEVMGKQSRRLEEEEERHGGDDDDDEEEDSGLGGTRYSATGHSPFNLSYYTDRRRGSDGGSVELLIGPHGSGGIDGGVRAVGVDVVDIGGDLPMLHGTERDGFGQAQGKDTGQGPGQGKGRVGKGKSADEFHRYGRNAR